MQQEVVVLYNEITVIDSIHKYLIRRGGIINTILNFIFVYISIELHSCFSTIASLQSNIPHIIGICAKKVVLNEIGLDLTFQECYVSF